MQKFNIKSESNSLKSVIIGSADFFQKDNSYVEKINDKQLTEKTPVATTLVKELDFLQTTLEKKGVNVKRPKYIGEFIPDQLTPRDIGVVIGDKFILCNLSSISRRFEAFGIIEILNSFDLTNQTVLIPEGDAFIEGGDIIVDKEFIFVGQSNRTNKKGLEFIIRHFSKDYTIIPIQVNDQPGYSKFLHLDCVFNPVGSHHAFFYPNGIGQVSDRLKENYELIEITEEEQSELAANVLTISPNTIVARKHERLARVNGLLSNFYEVIEIEFGSVVLTGGSIRCATLPLIRL